MTSKTKYDCVANPLAELAIQSAKYAVNHKHLHLGNKQINSLGNDFYLFQSLETLWINNNNLSSLEGLESNIRLKGLYLHQNHFTSLISNGESYSILRHFTFLKELTLHDNRLQNLSTIVSELKFLPYLTMLNLYNNPCEQEDNYRLLVIGNLPQLEIFDRHHITETDRLEAKKLLRRLSKLQSSLLNTTNVNHDPNFTTLSSSFSSSTTIMMADKKTTDISYVNEDELRCKRKKKDDIVKRLGSLLNIKRIFLENDFIEYDKRSIRIIDYEIFWKILQNYGLYDILTSEERELIEESYGESISVDALTKTHSILKRGIHYQKFCDDVLPNHMRYHIPPSKEHCAVAKVVVDLDRYVKGIEEKKRQQSEKEWKTTTRLLATQAIHSLNDKNGNTNINVTFLRPIPIPSMVHGFDPWSAYEVSKIISTYEDKNPIQLSLSVSDVNDILLQIRNIGKEPIESNDKVLRILFGISETDTIEMMENTRTISIDFLRKAFGCSTRSSKRLVTTAENLTRSPIKSSSKTILKSPSATTTNTKKIGSIPSSSTKQDINTNFEQQQPTTTSAPVIRFCDVSPETIVKIENQSFHKANEVLDTILRSKDNTNTKDLVKVALNLSLGGIRMIASKSKSRPKTVETVSKPEGTIVKASSNRSDIIIIPNLIPTNVTSPDFQEKEWRNYLVELGLSGELLELAMERKRRTNISQYQERMEQSKVIISKPSSSSSSSLSSSSSIPSVVSNVRPLVKETSGRLTKSSIQPKYSWEKGWGPNTGVVVFRNEYVSSKRYL